MKKGNCCAVCGKPLTDPVSVDIGIGPVCRMNRKKRQRGDRESTLFDKIALYTWGIDGRVIWIKDPNEDHRSVTNDAENVLTEIAGELDRPLTDYLVMYRDSEGIWDQIVIKSIGSLRELEAALGWLENRRKTGRDYWSRYVDIDFYSLNEKDYQAAMTKLLEREPAPAIAGH